MTSHFSFLFNLEKLNKIYWRKIRACDRKAQKLGYTDYKDQIEKELKENWIREHSTL